MAEEAGNRDRAKQVFRVRLPEAMRARGLKPTPRVLAVTVRVGVREADRYLKGERLPGPLIMPRFERALGTTAGWLVGEDSPEKGPGSPEEARSGHRPTSGGPNQIPLPDVAFGGATVVWDTVEDEVDLSVKDWKKVGEAVAKKWHSLIVERKLPFNDLLDLLAAEENWLRHKKHHAAASDIARLLANLHDFLDSVPLKKV